MGLRPRFALLTAAAWSYALCAAPVSAAELRPPSRLDAAPVPYPRGATGDASVLLVVVVDSNGAIVDVTVREGVAPFAEAAASAVRTWRFAPATRDGVPIAARILATVTFHAPIVAPAPPPPSVPSSPPVAAARPLPPPPPEEVAVKGEREELGTIHIPRTETQFVPGAFGDPFRIVEALPGMAPWLSGLPYYYVRGAPPESVGYFIDGIPVPLLFHVGAGPSTISPSLVDSVDLFAGGYPASYGRYAGAVIAGETTPPDVSKAHGDFTARVFDANAFIETPFDGGKGSVMAAGRYAYTGLLTSIIVPDYSVGYWDYQFRVSHKVAGDDRLTFFVFGAYDSLAFKSQPSFHIEYHRADLRYDHPLAGGNLRVAATFHADDTLTALQTDTGAGASASLRGLGGRLRAELDERVTPSARIRAGADVGFTHFSVDQFVDTVRAPHTDVEGGAYADVVWRPLDHVEIVPGFRLDGYLTRGATSVAPQPRLATSVRIAPAVTWISSLGTAHQEPTEEVFVPSKLPDAIDESRRTSYQYSEGIEARLPSSMRVRATAFYSRLVADQVGSETGEGVELFVQRDFTRRLGGILSYTLSRSVSTVDSTGRTTRSEWDRTHLVSLVLSYDLGAHWRVGGRLFVESGRPYQVCEAPGCVSGESPTTVSGNLPPFFRLDARLEKKWLFSQGRWLAGTIECFNVFDRGEPTGKTYSPTTGLTTSTQTPIILPSVGIEGGFQ